MIQLNFSPKIDLGKAARLLEEIKTDPMGGWVRLPLDTTPEELEKIHETAEKIRSNSEVLVCVGIGGSYLGHRAVIEALRPKDSLEILYAGNSLSKREMDCLLEKLGNRDFSVNVISKSGTTLEPARAFSVLKSKLADKYGMVGAAQRIYATTDGEKGELHAEALRNNYTRFVIPDNVGGRYSVLSPVGLLPMAVAGVDIDSLISGAAEMAKSIVEIQVPVKDEESEAFDAPEIVEASNGSRGLEKIPAALEPAVKYGFMRYLLGSKGYDTEVFASFEPATSYFNEWIKQLFGESEGKEGQGVWPASVIYSTDLHSLGQFMQEGRRNLWETIINYPTDDLNKKVVEAVQKAHVKGRIPVLKIDVSTYDEKGFGELIYFFEMACAISAKLFGVNPFDQPGVEEYKKNLALILAK